MRVTTSMNATETALYLPPVPAEIPYEEGCAAILEQMQSDRPTLKEYIDSRVSGSAKCAQGWQEVEPDGQQALFIRGEWNAFRDIQRILERGGFKPDVQP